MFKSSNLLVLMLSTLLAFGLTISPFGYYFPQIIAGVTVVYLASHFHPVTAKLDLLTLGLIAFIVNLLVFATHGLNSPLFFLIYFLLFAFSFNIPPAVNMIYSVFLIIILSQSLNSPESLIPLFSIIFVTPLAWFVGIQSRDNIELKKEVTTEETDILLWLSLRFKNSITQVIDALTVFSLDPKLTAAQRRDIINIRRRSKSLLTSSRQLVDDIEEDNPFDE